MGIADAFVAARRAGRSLPDFPGEIPAGLAAAYAVQDAALTLWGEPPIGWKVGRIDDTLVAELGAGRLIGPIFASGLRRASPPAVHFPVFPGGFAAVEAEFVMTVATDTPRGQTGYTADEAAALAGDLHIAVETAGSPLATINALGPRVVISDFGNNAGLILGATIPDWRAIPQRDLVAETTIDGVSVGTGTAADLPGGLFAAFAFALGNAASRGRPLRRGALVSTGAITGVHAIGIGQSARLSFGALGSIDCVAVRA